jgi:hypothetical protein
MKFSRIISFIGGEYVFSRKESCSTGFDKILKREASRYFRAAVTGEEKRD